ncbi:MAG: hypothetical protein HOC20_00110, partial [Chloroflexi bacterium]|nr:hypothetical protein [Chloroflexota bacterium]
MQIESTTSTEIESKPVKPLVSALGQVLALPKRRRKRNVWLNVLPDDHWLRVRKGLTVHEALHGVDTEMDGDCGG